MVDRKCRVIFDPAIGGEGAATVDWSSVVLDGSRIGTGIARKHRRWRSPLSDRPGMGFADSEWWATLVVRMRKEPRVPYKGRADLPDGVRDNLPAHAQDIYIEAFNSAFEQYDHEEERAHRVAWGAVERKYHKNASGKWVEGATEDNR